MSTDEQRIARWLDWLRDGSEADKIAARRGLAGVFEARGMLDEAIELLEHNVEAGVRGADTLRWLSRLYEARDVGFMGSGAEDPAAPVTHAPLLPAMPDAAGVPAGSLSQLAIADLAPYLAMVVGLGVTLGTALWLLMPL